MYPAKQPLNIALLIDADNAPAAKIDAILAEISKYGVTNIRRAYGNWSSSNLKPWAESLHEFAIQPIQQFDYIKGKNATDMALVIDAMDLLYTRELNAFAIVSSDCDFTPLVMRILENGLKVYGFGERKAADPFTKACSTFFYLDTLASNSSGDEVVSTESDSSKPEKSREITPLRQSGKELKQDTKLISILRQSIDVMQDDDGWASLSAIGQYIANRSSLTPQNYGYAKLSYLLDAIDLFDVDRTKKLIKVRRVKRK